MDKTIDLIDSTCENLKETLLAKNKGYRESVFCENVFFPHTGKTLFIAARISDKIHRIRNLEENICNPASDDESRERWKEELADALLDAAGYFVLWSVYEKQKKDCDV